MHFLIPREYSSLIGELDRLASIEDFPHWMPGTVIWGALTYVVLREFRSGLSLGTKPLDGAMNFAHVQTWRNLGNRCGEYRISARADYRQLYDVDFEILQNPCQSIDASTKYIPHWPVPGLLSRDQSRKKIENIAYSGRTSNGNLDKDIFSNFYKNIGLELKIIEPYAWHDMSEIDLLVAVRSLDKRNYLSKPASKLFCAWQSNIPLIAGWDSAFSYHGEPGSDYFRVSNMNEIIETVSSLLEDAQEYEMVVQNGSRKAESFSFDKTAERWLDLIDDCIVKDFEKWCEFSSRRRIFKIGPRAVDRIYNEVSKLRHW